MFKRFISHESIYLSIILFCSYLPIIILNNISINLFSVRPGYLHNSESIGRWLATRGSIPCQVLPKTQKWFLMPPCLIFSFLRYGLRVKWFNPGKGVAPSPTSRYCSFYKKGALGSPSTTVSNFTYFFSVNLFICLFNSTISSLIYHTKYI